MPLPVCQVDHSLGVRPVALLLSLPRKVYTWLAEVWGAIGAREGLYLLRRSLREFCIEHDCYQGTVDVRPWDDFNSRNRFSATWVLREFGFLQLNGK